MTAVLAICVAVTFSVSIYLMLDRELKSIAMGVFLIGHAANLSIIAMSGSPVVHTAEGTTLRTPPVLSGHGYATGMEVDPLPQALILTAIVIGFAVMAFLLTLLVVTARKTETLNVDLLAKEGVEDPTH